MTNREKLIKLLQSHDWYYEYSEDIRCWREGFAEYQKIRELIPLVEDGQELFEQYFPDEKAC